ncbi:MAG: hypothetical protein M1827_006178 [Pycnora praestabilis]|nr:MAG: hypothetical protein M1827_006178 [Pycnora praestabilis]
MPSVPEEYYFDPTPFVPNSPFPVLIYRSALPTNPTAQMTRECLEANQWIQGGVFKTYRAHHFHSVTHECYAVFRGSSKVLLGRGPLDSLEGGAEVDLRVGDAIVLPVSEPRLPSLRHQSNAEMQAGVAHCSLSSEGDYEYVGLYPKGSPHWDNNFCKAGGEETQEKASIARSVPIPEEDPVFGAGGPLVDIWRRAIAK